MSEKDLYRDFNKIKIDEQEFDSVDICLNDLQKNKMKNNIKKRIKSGKHLKLKICAASAAAAFILILGIGFTNPSFASQIPLLNPLVEMLGHSGDYANYSQIVNKTVTCGGKSFTINSVVCYDNIIEIGYTAVSDKKLDATGPLFFPTFTVNGKWLNVGFSGGQQNLDSNKAIGTIQLVSDDMELPASFKLGMFFNKLDGTSGSWSFRMNISKAELGKNNKTYKLNQVISFDNHSATITKISVNPLSTILSLHSASEPQIPNFILLDDKGNELQPDCVNSGKQGTNGFNATSFYSKADKDTKFLILIPCLQHGEKSIDSNGKATETGIPDPVVTIPISTKLPVDVSEGKNGKVTLTQISYSDDMDSVTIKGMIYGKFPNYQLVHLEGDNPKADILFKNNVINKVGEDKYEFTELWTGLKNDKNYKITVPNIDFIDYDSRITLPLK